MSKAVEFMNSAEVSHNGEWRRAWEITYCTHAEVLPTGALVVERANGLGPVTFEPEHWRTRH